MIYSESPRRKQIHQQVSWGHWFAFANILIAIAISSIYMFSTTLKTTPISFVYMITMWIGHISFVAFLGFVILVLPLCYRLQNIRILRAVSAIIAALALAILAFDALIYTQTGFHLSFSSAELLRSETSAQVNAFSWLQWFYLGMLFVIWLMLQLVIANAIYKRLNKFQRFKFTPYLVTFFVLCFVSSHAIRVWADARLYSPILKQDNMFPLSYPATAKTLMARYGLIDLETREQQEELQHLVGNGFVYPPQPVYCSVNSAHKVIVLASYDATESPFLAGMQQNDYHLVTESVPRYFTQQILYGIPPDMAQRASVAPVLLDLLDAFQIPTFTFSIADEQADAGEFFNAIRSSENGFFYGLLNAQQLSSLSLEDVGENASILVIARSQDSDNFSLFSNFIASKQASSNEDIAPTVLQQFGCMAEVNRYSTGQALQAPKRDWLVSTKGENLVIVRYPMMTEVARDGSYEVTDLEKNQEILVDIDTNLLSRSIKHLENFSR